MVKFEESDEEEDKDWVSSRRDPPEKKETSILGRVFNKPKPAPTSSVTARRRIVEERWEREARGWRLLSCYSSSDEDEYKRDLQLRQDIHQLERTLNNYDTKFDTGQAKLKKLKVRLCVPTESCD